MLAHAAQLNNRLGAQWINTLKPDFGNAIKGKRTVESIKDAIALLLANTKIELNALADRLDFNRKALVRDGTDWFFLFADFAQVAGCDAATFDAIAAQRINRHKEVQTQLAEKAIKDAEAAAAKRKADAEAAETAAQAARDAAKMVEAVTSIPVEPITLRAIGVPGTAAVAVPVPPHAHMPINPSHELILHIGTARFGRFPTAPKVGPEWWAKLYELADKLGAEL